MSDSDDTDVLLLARPSVFIEESARVDPLPSVEIVDNLISHVSDLENRVSIIEIISSPRGNSFCRDYKSISPMVSHELETSLDQSVVSDEFQTQVNLISPPSDDNLTTPPLVLNTSGVCSNTESTQDLTAICSNDRPKYKETLLKEIDTYLSNVKPSVSSNKSKVENVLLNMDRNKGTMSKPVESIADRIIRRSSPDDRLDLPAVDRLLREMEATHLEIENKLQMREAEYSYLNQKPFSNVTNRRSFPPVDNNSLPARGNGSYEHHSSPLKSSFEVEKPKSLEDLAGKRDVYLVGSSHNSDSDDARKNNFSTSNSLRRDSHKTNSNSDTRRRFVSPRRRLFSQPDNYGNKKLTSIPSPSTATDQDIQRRNYFTNYGGGDGPQSPSSRITENKIQKDKVLNSHYNRNNLLSLADLWRSERDLSDDDSKKIRQKLEEEKLRRIHLENTIQELQRRVLEEQERLAVAVNVDEGKDKAIAQITEAWKQMVNHWKDIEADRHAMSQAIIKERATMKLTQEEMNKKVERWEKEVSQALDLAAGYKSKCEFLENELSATKEAHEEKLTELENKLKAMEEELQKLNEERKLLTDKLNISEEDHRKEKKLVELAQKELSALQEVMKKTDGELSIVQEQRDLLSTRLREEKGRNMTLEQHKNSILESLEELKQKLNESEETVRNLTMTLERTKTDLRSVYQGQLEAVVKEKLEEFQNQLDQAQVAMKAEVNETRRQAQERAAAQQQALVNRLEPESFVCLFLVCFHVIEMRRLETMHKEEMKALEDKLVESERQREKLESGKKEIAHKLHGVMESQWQQALSIITSEISMKQGEDDLKRKDNFLEEQSQKMMEAQNIEETKFSKDGRGQSKQDMLLKYIQMVKNDSK